jgi:hypothetical protein
MAFCLFYYLPGWNTTLASHSIFRSPEENLWCKTVLEACLLRESWEKGSVIEVKSGNNTNHLEKVYVIQYLNLLQVEYSVCY